MPSDHDVITFDLKISCIPNNNRQMKCNFKGADFALLRKGLHGKRNKKTMMIFGRNFAKNAKR